MKLNNLIRFYENFLINSNLLIFVILVMIKPFNTLKALNTYEKLNNVGLNVDRTLVKQFPNTHTTTKLIIMMKHIPIEDQFHHYIYPPFGYGKQSPTKSINSSQTDIDNQIKNHTLFHIKSINHKKNKKSDFKEENLKRQQIHLSDLDPIERKQTQRTFNQTEIDFQLNDIASNNNNMAGNENYNLYKMENQIKNSLQMISSINSDNNNNIVMKDIKNSNGIHISNSSNIDDRFNDIHTSGNHVDTKTLISNKNPTPTLITLKVAANEKYQKRVQRNIIQDENINNEIDVDDDNYNIEDLIGIVKTQENEQMIDSNNSQITSTIRSRQVAATIDNITQYSVHINNCNGSNYTSSINNSTYNEDNRNCNHDTLTKATNATMINNQNNSKTALTVNNNSYIENSNNSYNYNNSNNNLTMYNEEEDECSLECDDCIPCNVTYNEYMQYLYDYIYPSKYEWILIATHGVVFLTGLIGNALVCIAVYTNYSMRTVTNVYIVNLAIADFFVILICLPPSVVWDVTETWFLGRSMCKIVLYFQSISVTVSVLTLTFISVDRWYAICFPLRYRTKITRAVASVAFIWIVALASDVHEFLALTIKPMNSKLRYETVLFTQCQTSWDIQTEKNFYIVRLVTLYILPLFLMTIAYFKIVRVLWKSDTIPGHRESRNHQQYSTCGYSRGSQQAASNSSTMGQLRARRKAAKMLVAVVIMFAVCYAPVHIFNLMRYTDTLPHNDLTSIFSLLSHWLCYANSAINPIIYNFMSGKFRREFRNALEKCRCARIRVEDRSLNHSTPASRMNNVSPSSRSNYQLTSVRDITRDMSRHTMQTTFVENYGNGHSASIAMLNNEKKDEIT